MPSSVRSHAKINLGLGIGAPRADGFHALSTVYQTLALHDLIQVTAAPAATTTIQLSSNDSRVPTDSSNTAWKMVELALEALELHAAVRIHIDKRLPVQGGLGAGSANAVAALMGLEAELALTCTGNRLDRENAGSSTPFRIKNVPDSAQDNPISIRADGSAAEEDRRFFSHRVQEIKMNWPARRLEIAARVGSDVPLFLIGGAVLGLDRGQQVYPLPDFEPVWTVVAIPSVGVSTPRAFADWDALCRASNLTAAASTDKLNQLSRTYASAFAQSCSEGGKGVCSSGVLSDGEGLARPQESALVRTGILRWITNDFEQVVFPQHPSLSVIKCILAASGEPEAALHASLSGSGSALFGLYETRKAAQTIMERLQQQGVQSCLTRTLPRRQYWAEMLERN